MHETGADGFASVMNVRFEENLGAASGFAKMHRSFVERRSRRERLRGLRMTSGQTCCLQ